jgi:hypothetical protein
LSSKRGPCRAPVDARLHRHILVFLLVWQRHDHVRTFDPHLDRFKPVARVAGVTSGPDVESALSALCTSAPTAITTKPSRSLCPPAPNNRSSCITSKRLADALFFWAAPRSELTHQRASNRGPAICYSFDCFYRQLYQCGSVLFVFDDQGRRGIVCEPWCDGPRGGSLLAGVPA